jgi:flavodoxin
VNREERVNTKIVYRTKTGHSRKIAKAMAENLKIEAVDAKDNPKLEAVDLLFIVGGIYGGKSNPDLIDFVQNLDPRQVKRVALITSCASRKFFQKEIRAALVAKGIEVVTEEVVCWGSFLIYGWGHPNRDDYDAAIAFAKRQM